MLVAYRVVRRHRQHRGNVALLEDPDAVVGEDVGDLLEEGLGVFQIVEHGDRGDDTRLSIAHGGADSCGGEEVGHQLDVRRIVIPELDSRGIHAEERGADGAVSLKEGAVVAPDIDDEIARAGRHARQGSTDDAAQMFDHPHVQAGPIAVVHSVHLFRDVRVLELHEPARFVATVFNAFD